MTLTLGFLFMLIHMPHLRPWLCGVCVSQVYSVEEKAALAMINFEEKKAKEQQVMQSMQALVKQHLQKEETQD